MNDVKTISNLTLAENSINNNDTKKNLDPEKLVNIPKKKFQSTPSLTLVKLGIRKDIFGEEIKKGGKQRISFADNILLKDDIINKNCENITRNKLDNFVEIIDVISYKKENKLNYYKSNSIASYDDEICCESCIIY